MKEVEVKARIKSKQAIMDKLQALGCKFGDVLTQSDVIFVPQDVVSLPADQGVPVLRIRDQNGKHIFTMKIRLTNGLDKQESETEISNPAGLREIILAMGFKEMVRFQKTRQKTRYQNWEVCVDEIEGLGYFMECEQLTKDGDSADIQAQMVEFLKTLGVVKSDLEKFGYDVILWQHQQKSS